MDATLDELVMMFGTLSRERVRKAQAFIEALPRMCRGLLSGCDLAIGRPGGAFVCVAHFRIPLPAQTQARIRYWSWYSDGFLAAPGGRVRAEASLDSCELQLRNVLPGLLPSAAASLLGRADPGPVEPEPEPLALALSLPSDGVDFDRQRGALFVPSPIAPPVGDDVPVRLQVPGRPPLSVGGVVASFRAAGEDGPGTPAGFVLGLISPFLEIAEVLERYAGPASPNGPRRRAPRYPVRARTRVSLRRGASVPVARLEYARPDDLARDYVENLSQGGAFIRTSEDVAEGTPILLEILLPTGQQLTVSATIVYRNERGIGVRFELEKSGEAVLAAAVEQAVLRRRRALIVDDDALARRMLGDALAERGFEVFAADDGVTGLQVLTDELLGLDLLVTDLRMPNMDGAQFLRKIRVAGGERDLAIVVVTGELPPDGGERLRQAGADAILEKSAGLERIADAAEDAALRGRLAASPTARGTGRTAA